MCTFICEFVIRGPKYQDLSTANDEAHLIFKLIPHQTRFTASNNFTISNSSIGKLISYKACQIFNLMLTLALLYI